jgi:hypothetical protein
MNKRAAIIFWCAVAATLAVGVIHASSLRFMTDDAFISFRYAKNLVKGLGLVYNAGERVEGFTNFLWTILIALGMKLNFDPVTFSSTLGIFFYLATLLLYGVLSFKLHGKDPGPGFLLPITAIALSLHHDVNVYATGGLETAMFMFLISAGFAVTLLAPSAGGLIGAGTLFVLAMMTRPDGVVFLAATVIYLLLTRREALKCSALFLTPSVLLFLPYWLWRFSYYGYFFPNSFYAKSIDLPYYSQGLEYTRLYFTTYYGLALMLILGGFMLWKFRDLLKTSAFVAYVRDTIRSREPSPHPLLLGLLLSCAYTVFIIRIGGDFMFARFFIPVTPILYFVTEHLIYAAGRGSERLLLAGMLALATIFRIDHFTEEPVLGYIADEQKYYAGDQLKRSKDDGDLLHKYFEKLPVKVGFWAGQVKLIYYADPALAIEMTTGLTDATIAHQELTERGRPGHEKHGPSSYLIKRNVNFYIGPSQAPPDGPLPVNAILFDRILARVIVYDDSLMSALAQYPEVKFVRVPEYLDAYIASIDTHPREEVRSDYAFLTSFYFDHNNDTTRRNAFLRFLGTP